MSKVIGVAMALSLVACSASAPALAQSPEMLRPHVVDLGHGRKMNIQCFGRGAPTVVFESGLGGSVLDWAKVQGAVSKDTKACFYDRAGMGWSEPSGRPSSLQNAADDLHELLKRSGVRGRIVLVGHSLGGLYAASYARRFPKDVAGLVLIDPTFAGPENRPKTPQERAEVDAANAEAAAPLVRCAALAEQRLLSRQDPKGCFTLPAGLDEASASYLLPGLVGPGRWRAMISELEVSATTNDTSGSFGNLPLIVLTHGAALRLPMDADESFAHRTAMIVRAHQALAAQSSRGRQVVVPEAGHYIQKDKPEAVTAAISQVIAEARKR